jgi:hypothetical protein
MEVPGPAGCAGPTGHAPNRARAGGWVGATMIVVAPRPAAGPASESGSEAERYGVRAASAAEPVGAAWAARRGPGPGRVLQLLPNLNTTGPGAAHWHESSLLLKRHVQGGR